MDIIWAGRGELTQWPLCDWFVLLNADGFQPVWDREPKTSAWLLAREVKRRSFVAMDTEAWRDNGLTRTTSVPILVNADHLKRLEQRWAAIKTLSMKPWERPIQPSVPIKPKVAQARQAASTEDLLAEVQAVERIAPTEAIVICSRTNKVRHKSKLWALHHRNHLATLPDERHPERLEVYKCKAGCGDWHVGHKA